MDIQLIQDGGRRTRGQNGNPAWVGAYYDVNRVGTYRCARCGNTLFSTSAKLKGMIKLLAFWAPFSTGSVQTSEGTFHSMIRNGVTCCGCDTHLGYVIKDGSQPTGLRYLINIIAVVFEGKKEGEAPSKKISAASAA